MISDATFRAAVIGLLSVVVGFMLIAFLVGILTYIRFVQIHNKVRDAIENIQNNVNKTISSIEKTDFQNVANRAGDFIKALPQFRF